MMQLSITELTDQSCCSVPPKLMYVCTCNHDHMLIDDMYLRTSHRKLKIFKKVIYIIGNAHNIKII
jgi:hypothetical protein